GLLRVLLVPFSERLRAPVHVENGVERLLIRDVGVRDSVDLKQPAVDPLLDRGRRAYRSRVPPGLVDRDARHELPRDSEVLREATSHRPEEPTHRRPSYLTDREGKGLVSLELLGRVAGEEPEHSVVSVRIEPLYLQLSLDGLDGQVDPNGVVF